MEPPILGELVEDVARGRDRVAAVEETQPRVLRGGNEAERERAVAGHVPVLARLESRGLDHVRVERFDRLAVVVPGFEGAHVRFGQWSGLLEPVADRLLLALRVARVDPEHQAQRVEVLAPARVLRGDAGSLDGLAHEPLEVDLDHAVVLDRAVGERIRLPAGAIEIRLLEGRFVEDEQAAALQIGQVHLQGRRIHGHERVRLVAGRVDLVSGELDLVARHAGGRAGRRPDLRRIIREGGQIVAVEGGFAGEFRPRELHAIARIACEPHDGILDVDVGPGRGGNRHRLFLLRGAEPTRL